jgi:hypothetical protein
MSRSRVVILVGLAAALSLAVETAGSATLTSGAQLWLQRYNGSGNGNDLGRSVAASPDGTKVFVTGRVYAGSTTGYDYVTIAYNASTGAKLWSARYSGPGNGTDEAKALALSADGTRVFVTGESTGSATDWDFATVAYKASTGAKLWSARYDGPASGADNARSLALSPDGTKVIVTGGSYGGTSNGDDYATVAYDASTGTKLWATRYNGPASKTDRPFVIVAAPDGTKVFVTGESFGGSVTHLNYATIAYNASTGAKVWSAFYNGAANDYDAAYAIAPSPDGSKVFVTGESWGGASPESDYLTIAYNAGNGAKQWDARYNGPGDGNDYGYDVAVSPSGTRLFVTGESYGSAAASQDYATVAYNASTGAKVWSARYNGPGSGNDYGLSLASSPDGTKVFVTGQSYGGSAVSSDFATIGYNASTGSKLWATRYNGTGSIFDAGYDVAVAPDGTKVYVAGESYGGTTSKQDAVTIAYQP